MQRFLNKNKKLFNILSIVLFIKNKSIFQKILLFSNFIYAYLPTYSRIKYIINSYFHYFVYIYEYNHWRLWTLYLNKS